MSPKWSLKHARPDGPSFSRPESNSGIFCRTVRTSKSFRPDGLRLDAYSGHPDGQLIVFFCQLSNDPNFVPIRYLSKTL
jgi:hypothetical protein